MSFLRLVRVSRVGLRSTRVLLLMRISSTRIARLVISRPQRLRQVLNGNTNASPRKLISWHVDCRKSGDWMAGVWLVVLTVASGGA